MYVLQKKIYQGSIRKYNAVIASLYCRRLILNVISRKMIVAFIISNLSHEEKNQPLVEHIVGSNKLNRCLIKIIFD